MADLSPPRIVPVFLADLPLPGLPPSAIDAQEANGFPARLTKPNGYTAVNFGWRSDCTGSGDYALYRYWPEDKDWKPEGPRGSTPTTINMATPAGQCPPRVSVPEVECQIAIILCAGGPIAGFDFGNAPVAVEFQIR